MLALKQYNELQQKALNQLSLKRNREVKIILQEIDGLNDIIYLTNQKLMPSSTMMYKAKTIKFNYQEQLGYIIREYQSIIFPDLFFNNDINGIVTTAFSLKTWLVRYLCLLVCNESLTSYVDEEFANMSVTEQYQYLDVILFNLAIASTVKN